MRSFPLAYQPDALELFAPLLRLSRPVLLHSADRNSRFGRYDICSAAPHTSIEYRNQTLHLGAKAIETLTPLAELRRIVGPRQPPTTLAPFSGGFLGFLGYELHQSIERQRPAPPSPGQLPTLWGGLYDWSLVTDHQRQTTTLLSPDLTTERYVLEQLATSAPPGPQPLLAPFKTTLPAAEYQQAFEQIIAYIQAGDCYQVNLAAHFETQIKGAPLDLYRLWLAEQPAPFCAYLGLAPDHAVISLSPERFFTLKDRQVSVSPIKGTRGRREHPGQDALARLDLLSSNKDRAENLMIVDLLRNDLGRVCVPGSVLVSHLFEPVAFANVHHLVSTVEGQLNSNQDVIDLIAALFPCGSVTGAPKIRAIDIINELEPVGRSVYCGAIGYIDESGGADFSVAIRTAVMQGEELHLWGGGGLVADSQPDREREEIHEKIGRLLATGFRLR